jgi:hypothetical protein
VLKQAARGRCVHLWDEDLALAEAQVTDQLTDWVHIIGGSSYSSCYSTGACMIVVRPHVTLLQQCIRTSL